MEPIQTTDEVATRTLRKIVSENPDYVYTREGVDLDYTPEARCLYVHGDKPGCGIGHLLHRLGVPLDELRVRERDSAVKALKELTTGIRDSVRFALGEFQSFQDSGGTWADSYRMAFHADADFEV